MVKVICKEDCGNAPKKLLLKELTSAFAKGTAQRVLFSRLADDVAWEIVGTERIKGKDAIARMLSEAAKSGNKASQLVIENLITHGNAGSVNGHITMTNGKQYAFCDIYVWNGSSAKSVISVSHQKRPEYIFRPFFSFFIQLATAGTVKFLSRRIHYSPAEDAHLLE